MCEKYLGYVRRKVEQKMVLTAQMKESNFQFVFSSRMRVFENRVLRIFGPKRDVVRGEWRKLCNEELNDLYSSPNTVQVINSRIMRW